MIRFNESLILKINSSKSVIVSVDVKEPVVMRGSNIPSLIAKLIDGFAWEKIVMCHELVRDNFQWLGDAPPPEHKYDYDEDNSIIIVLRKEERVKSFLDKQPLPVKLLNALPADVKRELFITKKQFQFIQFLTEGLDDVMISERELHSLTKKEASALIKHLQALQTNPTP